MNVKELALSFFKLDSDNYFVLQGVMLKHGGDPVLSASVLFSFDLPSFLTLGLLEWSCIELTNDLNQ